MGICFLGVAEERVRDPDFADHVAVETQNLHGAVELQTPVIPGLGKEDVNGVFLKKLMKNILELCATVYIQYLMKSIAINQTTLLMKLKEMQTSGSLGSLKNIC